MKSFFLKSLFLIFFCIGTFFIYAQTFYETKFKDNRGNSYIGFMVYYNESNCYMRVAYTQDNKYSVVNVEYEAITGTEDGINYMFLIGSNPTYITENYNQIYNPEHFIWFWDDYDQTEKPFYTTDPEFNPENIYEVDYFKIINLNELDQTYLRRFYATNDPDYLRFIEFINNDIEEEVIEYDYEEYTEYYENSNQTTLHLIVVANTSIGDIGQSCLIDKRNFISEFRGVAEALSIPIKEYIVEDDEFSKYGLVNALQKVNAGSNDVIIFLYTGHGFRLNEQSDKYPQFDLRINTYQQLTEETSISASSVYNALVEKGARLTLVLTNCCNSNIGINQLTSSSFLATMSNKNFNNNHLSKLILESNGSLISTAASPNEYAWCNNANGSFYVCSFLESFREEISVLNDNPDWGDITKNTIEYARKKTSSSFCPNCKVQNGLMYLKITQ